MKKKFIFCIVLISIFLLSGCAVIYREDDKVIRYGIGKNEAKNTLERINKKQESEKNDVKWLNNLLNNP